MGWTHVTVGFVERFVAVVALNPVGVITIRMRNMNVAEVVEPPYKRDG